MVASGGLVVDAEALLCSGGLAGVALVGSEWSEELVEDTSELIFLIANVFSLAKEGALLVDSVVTSDKPDSPLVRNSFTVE